MSIQFVVKTNKFPTASAAMKRAIGAAFAQQRASVLADMQRRTPVDTGELRDSETVESDERSMTLRATAPHAGYVHQGTSRMSPRPFMTDTVDAQGPAILQAIVTAATRELS
jgi:HK97 gp10 family phage protein